ncbi:MAG: c-type cytochrome [Verrucomicrobiales bacterium]
MSLSPNPSTRDLFQRFLPPSQRRRALGSGFDPAVVLALTGDQERGRDLFHSPTGPQCSTCHQVEGKGRYSRDQLLHHITKPNASIEQQWHLHMITVGENNEPHTGFIPTSDAKNLRLLNTLGAEVEIATDQVTSNVELPTSLMPEGTLDNLTAQEAADLLAFLLR